MSVCVDAVEPRGVLADRLDARGRGRRRRSGAPPASAASTSNVGARHDGAVVDGRARRRPREVDAADHGPESRCDAARGSADACAVAVDAATRLGSRRERHAADVPAERGAVPGRERAAARLRGPLPRAGPPPARASTTPTERVFGSVGIREGYEVGDHGAQSLFRVGCRVQMTEVEAHADGTFDIVAVGLERIELERLDTTGAYPVGHVVDRPEHAGRRRPPRSLERGPGDLRGLPRRRCSRSAARPARRRRCPRTRRTSPGRLAAVAPAPAAGAPGAARGRGRRRAADAWCTELLRAELRAMK